MENFGPDVCKNVQNYLFVSVYNIYVATGCRLGQSSIEIGYFDIPIVEGFIPVGHLGDAPRKRLVVTVDNAKIYMIKLLRAPPGSLEVRGV